MLYLILIQANLCKKILYILFDTLCKLNIDECVAGDTDGVWMTLPYTDRCICLKILHWGWTRLHPHVLQPCLIFHRPPSVPASLLSVLSTAAVSSADGPFSGTDRFRFKSITNTAFYQVVLLRIDSGDAIWCTNRLIMKEKCWIMSCFVFLYEKSLCVCSSGGKPDFCQRSLQFLQDVSVPLQPGHLQVWSPSH